MSDQEGNETKQEILIKKSSTENDIHEVVASFESKLSTFWQAASRNFTNPGRFVTGQLDNIQSDVKATEKKKYLTGEPTNEDGFEEETSSSLRVDGPKLGIDLASISISANKALDELDSKLELVEKQAGKLVNSITSFFSETVSADSMIASAPDTQRNALSPLFPGDAYGTTRYDMELFTLHTKKALFTRDYLEDDEADKFNVNAKTEDISQLLTHYSRTLGALMKELVPVSFSYKEFWFIYFRLEGELRASETARKNLLSEGSDDIPDSRTIQQNGEVTEGPVPSIKMLDGCNRGSEKQKNDKIDNAGDEFSWDDDD